MGKGRDRAYRSIASSPNRALLDRGGNSCHDSCCHGKGNKCGEVLHDFGVKRFKLRRKFDTGCLLAIKKLLDAEDEMLKTRGSRAHIYGPLNCQDVPWQAVCGGVDHTSTIRS